MNKKVHFARFAREDGHMSTQCSEPPARLNPQHTLWTTVLSKVTCERCLDRLQSQIERQRSFDSWTVQMEKR
jgi:hypothetical protein